jgi:hypothetical protein
VNVEAVALKVAEVAPDTRLTNAGTVSEALLLARITLNPPAGALRVSVTVHLPMSLGPRMAGLQATPESGAGASRLSEAVCVLPPRVEVTVAL